MSDSQEQRFDERTNNASLSRDKLSEDFSAKQIARTICAVPQGGDVLARGEHSLKVFSDAIEGAITLLESLFVDPE